MDNILQTKTLVKVRDPNLYENHYYCMNLVYLIHCHCHHQYYCHSMNLVQLIHCHCHQEYWGLAHLIVGVMEYSPVVVLVYLVAAVTKEYCWENLWLVKVPCLMLMLVRGYCSVNLCLATELYLTFVLMVKEHRLVHLWLDLVPCLLFLHHLYHQQ